MGQTSVIYNQADIAEYFDEPIFHRGQRCYERGRVSQYRILSDERETRCQTLEGRVEGSGYGAYKVHIDVTLGDPQEARAVYFDCDCTCSVGRDCQHALALLLQVMSVSCYRNPQTPAVEVYQSIRQQAQARQTRSGKTTTVASFTQWVNGVSAKQAVLDTPINDVVLYIFDVTHVGVHPELRVTAVLSRRLKSGGYGKVKRYSKTSVVSQRATTQDDKRFMALLKSLQESTNEYSEHTSVRLKDADSLLAELLETQRVFWQTLSQTPLVLGGEKNLEVHWEIRADGTQQPGYRIDGIAETTPTVLLPVAPLWYYNASEGCCGPLKSTLPAYLLVSLLALPPVEPKAVKAVQQQLQQWLPRASQLPVSIKRVTTKAVVHPEVSVRLFGQNVMRVNVTYRYGYTMSADLAFAELRFHYAERMITLQDPGQTVSCYQDGRLLEIPRDTALEQRCIDYLIAADIQPFAFNTEYVVRDTLHFLFLLDSPEATDEVLLAKLSTLHHLARQHHWRIQMEESFPIPVIDEIEEWYSDIDGSGIDWFSLTLGVVVEGKKINLLPLLVDVIQNQFGRLDSQAIAALPDETPCPLKLDNGHYIAIPFPRIRNIVLVLCELFENKPLDSDGALHLSKLQAGLLIEIEKAVGASELRWFGGKRLREFAKKLAHFEGIQPVAPAKTFTASLRPYQQQGLNWMQFLREYELGGILADDMGLGKTVQTLAQLNVEHAAKRLKKPSLLVAPTSLVNNWVSEAKRFAPDLSVLVLHGANRSTHFDEMVHVDLVITTYPLVLRDKETLLAQAYYYLILDEAQQIKNAKAKATQILLQIQAQHRLCLTGTPMENHLGELWSLFHFIVPGLLGSAKRFKALFRAPIERHANQDRHQQLIQRIKPFMLRRRKDDVAHELPTKTEMVRHIELAGAQRDLYESVRLSMERRVRDVISQKGFNRSQIMILDALLKLRQICCAPSLLKLKTVKKDIESAKLHDLMSFVPNLLEEGRRILLFSSFTSMLALIEAWLQADQIDYVKLTGSTRDRKTPIERFQSGEVPLFLISLKAGGLGLNLTAADTVIHYDPWWNPAAEQQATDRAHRIGQKKPVFVYKLITKGTVEEKILEMQKKKRALLSGVLDHQAHQESVQLTHEDLNVLLQPIES